MSQFEHIPLPGLAAGGADILQAVKAIHAMPAASLGGPDPKGAGDSRTDENLASLVRPSFQKGQWRKRRASPRERSPSNERKEDEEGVDSDSDDRKIRPSMASRAQALRLELGRYSTSARFGPYLRNDCALKTDLSGERLGKMSYRQLKDLRERVEVCIGSRIPTKFVNAVACAAAVGIEAGAAAARDRIPSMRERLDLTGFASEIQQDDVFLDAVEQISIQKGIGVNLSPEARIAISMANCAMRVNAKNLMRGAMRPRVSVSVEAKQPSPEVIVERPPSLGGESVTSVTTKGSPTPTPGSKTPPLGQPLASMVITPPADRPPTAIEKLFMDRQ